MGSSWGPQIDFAQEASGTLAGAGPFDVLTTTARGLNEVVGNVLLLAMVEINADADATGVTLTLWRGDSSTGELILTARFTSDQYAGQDNVVNVQWVDTPGPGANDQIYTLTAGVPGASGASNLGDCSLVAIAF